MKLEKQVCSLELAKRLKGLGVKKVSIFGWVNTHKGWILIRATNDNKPLLWGEDDCKLQSQKDNQIAAFTVAELGEMLPYRIIKDNDEYIIKMDIEKIIYYEEYTCKTNELYAPDEDIDKPSTEADGRAKMLIYLIENNLVKPS